MNTPFFNAHHSPIGSFSSFTLGEKGSRGGFGLEIGKPADQAVYIGCEEASGVFRFLPFFEYSESDDERSRYEVGGASSEKTEPQSEIRQFTDHQISRDFYVSTDTWNAEDLEFTVISPFASVPDPDAIDTSDVNLRLALVPAVLATLTLDNRKGAGPRRAIFGYEDPHMLQASSNVRRLDDTLPEGLVGIGQGRSIAIVSDSKGVVSGQSLTMSELLGETNPKNLTFALGPATALIATVEPGEIRTFRFAICFYRDGYATVGLDTSYYYTHLWDRIEDVAAFALKNFENLSGIAESANSRIEKSKLSQTQKFMLNHAIRSYYGSTQLLRRSSGQPLWIVNEGEYRMINTLDLTADQVFFELALNPWTVRNEMEIFAERYSYTDRVYYPGKPETTFPGGISFTHDMGVANVFSRPHYSAYEKYGLDGCFSHMTHEELVNWLCCALAYGHLDPKWLSSKITLVTACFDSMVNRDDPDSDKRNGVMSLESTRCAGGAEITTYDSLDVSLGQSRGNVYLASKCWAAYVGLEKAFRDNNLAQLAAQAKEQATKCAHTVAASVGADGTLSAIIGEDVEARIIPAIEGLVFPALFGVPQATSSTGEYSEYIAVLKQHLKGVLHKGICLFANGGWKLSSTSDNSWLSKIYLSQYIARQVLGIDGDEVTASADDAHASWLLDPQNTYWAWSDQILSGHAVGSKYYPRGVTAWLWLSEK